LDFSKHPIDADDCPLEGTPIIGSLDMLIVAHALSTACTLITYNEGEFARIPNLKIENWVKRCG
jgi:tRNA(fMet)-specific endonuclease VapC